MYIQGDRYYNDHVAKYGHPSKFGFMELINLWKGENWDPEQLIKLYKQAGAKYFCVMANHHDNFDTYNSKYQPWNSVNVGPKKDIVGIWGEVARKNGLRFGVTNHSSHAWHWLQTAYGYDAEGPLAGVRYDAATLTKADGKGKWWEGLDPQDLYTGSNIKMPDSLKTIKEVKDWHEKNDRAWNEKVPAQNPAFAENWFLRCQDLVDKYHPDLLYFDNTKLPLEQYGIDMVAHYYNANMKWNKGKLEAVVTTKDLTPLEKTGVVADVERGFCDDIQPQPWQTCSCIGDWHYKRELFEKNRYKSVGQVVGALIDIVSKNGNLLLSIPVRGDGSIDSIEVAFLKGMGKWMDINGEAIFDTRPWLIYGEGPTKVKAGTFNEKATKSFASEDIRFTIKGKTLYAFVMKWPETNNTLIKSLAVNSPQLKGRKINKVSLLGYNGKIEWSQTDEGLKVQMPTKAPCENAVTLKIEGTID
jgi:alpha-L-fucosidase